MRQAQFNPHEKYFIPPKVILAGRLAGTLDGRSWSLEAEAETVTLSVTSIWSLFKVRRVVRCALRQLPH